MVDNNGITMGKTNKWVICRNNHGITPHKTWLKIESSHFKYV
jgi:hypothetical protein